ncbi:type VI secretion system-associated FHA domain protein [Xenorhabdus innexi]|uniref:FHA domain protein n=1 Tax=Xenorhabdus innexi TaxID=290109 RepID=A0A1N6MYJ4_9GAMM|nr:type VI secretion system-associated FHA domain protein [Xenorhabdus innexi]PHM27393.1 putative FHA domain protein [Xenorhabdus innexi]SIP73854.1 putative Type VI secretion system, FHA domain-containing protein [Xenorhabdus innexi]
MRFTIVKNTSTNQPAQLSYQFSPPGGTIGHCQDNSWVLPDEEQNIARVQVIVSISESGKCQITNLGSASQVLLNTIPVASDHQVTIRDGDVLNIGHYQIQAIDIKKSAPPQATTRVINPPFESDTQQSKIPNKVWDDLEQVFPNTSASPSAEKHQLPSERNDNHPLFSSQQESDKYGFIDLLTKIEPTTNLETLQSRETDPVSMFNSDNLFRQEDILNNNTPTTLFQNDKEYDTEYNDTENEIDPLELFSDNHRKQKKDIKNDNHLDTMLGDAVPLTPLDTKPRFTSVSPSVSANNIQSVSALFTTEELSRELSKDLTKSDTNIGKTEEIIFPATHSNKHPHVQDGTNHQTSVNHQTNKLNISPHITADDPIYERLNIEPISISTNEPVTDETKLNGKLLAALLDGMGLNDLRQPHFDEHRMYQLGQLVSQLTQGIVALNNSRTLLKREAEAGMTQLLSDANNPFKLLPSGQAVLVQMFGDHMPGFMSAEQATRDILTELQAHQLGMIAGMRAITVDILQLFHPTLLEQKARDEGGMPRLSLSSTYKAVLWEFLTKHYQKTAHEFEHNSGLFSKNFLAAYESEVNNYKNTQRKIKKQSH